MEEQTFEQYIEEAFDKIVKEEKNGIEFSEVNLLPEEDVATIAKIADKKGFTKRVINISFIIE